MTISVPAFVEVGDDDFKPVGECTESELRTAANSKFAQGSSLIDEGFGLLRLAEDATAR